MSQNYTADNIQVLEGLEAVRKRPAMYIGDIGVKGLHHLVYEVVDNSIDEALAGYAKSIQVTIHKDNSITTIDDGRGIPVGMHEKEGRSALEVVMTVLHAGGKFDKGSYKVSGGLHGVGVSCVNALSKHLKAEVHREGKIYCQEYEFGKPQYSVKETGTTDKTGTIITFHPDDSIFIVSEYNFDTLAARLRELSFLNKGIKMVLVDEREEENGEFKTETFHSEGGLPEFVQWLDKTREPLIEVPIYIEGGTHVSGFRRALTRTFKNYGDKNKLFDKLKFQVSGDDFREGLTALISVKVPEPQFEGQTKTKLGNNEVQGVVESAVGEALKNYLEENPKSAKMIIQKVILAATARHAARKARELVQRKNVLSGSGLPGKLADCASKNADECEIYLVEGDSAGGTAKQGRDRHFQAILPLRGKILNVEKAMEHKIYDNEEIRNIFTALGVHLRDDKTLNMEKLRYHKIIIMCDADIDGSHITTLILTFFFRQMRELIEQGHIYIASPPLYQVKKGKKSQYAWSEQQRENAITELAGETKRESVSIQRYKGLGEMNAEQLWETTMDPDRRTLKQVTIDSAAEADNIFSVLMGDEVPPRREFIVTHAKYANVDV